MFFFVCLFVFTIAYRISLFVWFDDLTTIYDVIITKSPILHPNVREYDKKKIKGVKPRFIKISFGIDDWKFFGRRGNRCARWEVKL